MFKEGRARNLRGGIIRPAF